MPVTPSTSPSATAYAVHADVAVITLANPPVNGLSQPMRAGIADGLRQALADVRVAAIVLMGDDKAFCAGADIREFGTPKLLAPPTAMTVFQQIETSLKPVVAALGGLCIGGGLEMALFCHFRIALPGTQIGLPEVKLGLLPGAGGTQLLPRAIGVEPAMKMILSGDPAPAERFAGTALIDEMVGGDLLQAALAFARKAVAERRPVRRVRDITMDFPNPAAFFGEMRQSIAASARFYPAPGLCIDAVEASLTRSVDEGMAYELQLFQQAFDGTVSKAMRHFFFAERVAAKIPDVPESTPTRRVDAAAVVGAGTMGGGIAMAFANAGIPVQLLEADAPALERGMATIRRNYDNSVKRGRLTAEKMQQTLARITPTLAYADLARADLVVEAVFEEMGVKEKVFRQLDAAMKPGAILASNTSTLDLDRIASFTARPQDVIGMHYFSPANVMKLLEVVRGAKTGKDVLATVMKLARRIRKVAVVSGVCDGFIGNRMVLLYLRQAMFMVQEGATPWQVDQALENWGMAMGPFRMMDLAGNDVSAYVRRRHYAEHPEWPKSVAADRLVDMGRYGQKTAAGWYRYEGTKAFPDPVVEQLIVDTSRDLGIPRRGIDASEIVERSIYCMVNEAARILQEGIAQRSSDIDVVYLDGYGFPLHRGGPMFYADTMGLPNVVAALRRHGANPHAHPEIWQPAPLLLELAAAGKTFSQ